MDKEKIITKIKFLLKLVESPNENESAAARAAADALISKYNIDLNELKDNTFCYPEESILFRSHVKTFWKNQLAVILASQFFCYVIEQKISSIEENNLPVEEFIYFIYGEEESDIENVKSLFLTLESKIDSVITSICKGRGDLFCNSFSEGLMNAVKYRIENGDFDFKFKDLKEEKAASQPEAIIKQSANSFPEKKPIENKRDVAEDKKPIDIIAYFKGEKAGMNLELEDLLSQGEIDTSLLLEDNDNEDEEDDDESLAVTYDFLTELSKKLGDK